MSPHSASDQQAIHPLYYKQPYQLQINSKIRGEFALAYYSSELVFSESTQLESFLRMLTLKHLKYLRSIRVPGRHFRCPSNWLHPIEHTHMEFLGPACDWPFACSDMQSIELSVIDRHHASPEIISREVCGCRS